MAWVRYDDNFHDHDKVAVVRAEAPEALALHLLANTWTSRTDRPGFVPSAIPTVLVGRAKGRKWTGLLVSAGLWVEVDGGWEFYNHQKYRAPESRQTPGTPEALSAKRAAAGRRGGVKTASKRAANGAANAASAQASEQQVSSNPCSPVVASNEATPEPEPVLLPRKRATPPPDDFALTPELRAWGREHCPHVADPAAETAQFLDYHRGKGSMQKDWTATWRTWMRKAEQYAIERGGGPHVEGQQLTWAQERGIAP